jgi:hypothetical protein
MTEETLNQLIKLADNVDLLAFAVIQNEFGKDLVQRLKKIGEDCSSLKSQLGQESRHEHPNKNGVAASRVATPISGTVHSRPARRLLVV